MSPDRPRNRWPEPACRAGHASGQLARMSESTPSPEDPCGAQSALPLHEAALAWCDRALVRELQSARADYAAVFRHQVSGNPFPTRFEAGTAAQFVVASHAGVPCGGETEAALRRLRAARAVENDFRGRVAAGEVALTGLRVKPQLDLSRTPVPTAWARLLVFDWRKASVRAEEVEYIEVQGERRHAPAVAANPAENRRQPAPTATPEPRHRGHGRRGRESYGPLIEEALLARFGDAFADWDADPGSKPENTVVAKELRKWLNNNYPERHRENRLPKEETIRTRVPEIYGRVRHREAVR